MNVKIQERVSLASLTTFGIGGSARYFVDVSSEAELLEALQWSKEKKLRHVVLAGGSNVLVPDEGLDVLVIHITGSDFSFADAELEAGAGCNLLHLIREAAERDLGGWEKLAGIPGTIGGAIRGNAGAFGPEIKDFVVRVRAFDTEANDVREFDTDACDFSYRHSFFKDYLEWIITRVWLKLKKSDAATSERLIKETIRERERRHIQNVRAAGSFFVNPIASKEVQELFEKEKGVKAREGRVPAGWLIEKTGLKGARVGDAVASEQHPNYLKNEGNARAMDVLALARKIKDAVQIQFNVLLEEEATILS